MALDKIKTDDADYEGYLNIHLIRYLDTIIDTIIFYL